MSYNINDLQKLANSIAEKYLGAYNRKLKARRNPPQPKDVNDAIWGTVPLSALEISVLDSPLLQRLRSVRQLGVVHWVYPTAAHSRFEHTIGVLHQTQQLINSINNQLGSSEPDS